MVSKAFQVLRIKAEQARRLKDLESKCKSMVADNAKKRTVKAIVNTFIIEPKLDRIGDEFFLKKNLQMFRYKCNYIASRSNGQNLHEFEIRAYQALGQNLLRKAFTGIKLISRATKVKNMEKNMIMEYQFRKWFNKWRQNYIIKA